MPLSFLKSGASRGTASDYTPENLQRFVKVKGTEYAQVYDIPSTTGGGAGAGVADLAETKADKVGKKAVLREWKKDKDYTIYNKWVIANRDHGRAARQEHIEQKIALLSDYVSATKNRSLLDRKSACQVANKLEETKFAELVSRLDEIDRHGAIPRERELIAEMRKQVQLVVAYDFAISHADLYVDAQPDFITPKHKALVEFTRIQGELSRLWGLA